MSRGLIQAGQIWICKKQTYINRKPINSGMEIRIHGVTAYEHDAFIMAVINSYLETLPESTFRKLFKHKKEE